MLYTAQICTYAYQLGGFSYTFVYCDIQNVTNLDLKLSNDAVLYTLNQSSFLFPFFFFLYFFFNINLQYLLLFHQHDTLHMLLCHYHHVSTVWRYASKDFIFLFKTYYSIFTENGCFNFREIEFVCSHALHNLSWYILLNWVIHCAACCILLRWCCCHCYFNLHCHQA